MKATERIARCSASSVQDLRAMIRGRVVISDPLIFVIEIAVAVSTSVRLGYLSPVVAMFQAKIISLAFAAIGVGALVPSAVMSVTFANIVSRNICREFVNQAATGQQAGVAKLAPLVTKAAAVALFILVPLPHPLPFYLPAGLSMLQVLPAILLWLSPRAPNGRALLVGCVVGTALGSLAAWVVGSRQRSRSLASACPAPARSTRSR